MKIFYTFSSIVSSDYLPKTSTTQFSDILSFVLGAFGAIAVLMVVIQGIKMIISQGNSEKVAQARRGIIYAIAGLVVALLAQVLVLFILGGAN